jgi:dihydropteroate synthase
MNYMDSVKISPNKSIHTLNCKGKLVSLEEPVIMGIINVTPDSFFLNSSSISPETCVEKAGKMLKEGAIFLDIGGQSTRPGSVRIEAQEELDRVLPVITAILQEFPDALLSIDTYHHKVAEYAVKAGVSMVNDISAGMLDDKMIGTVASLGVPFIAMHMKGAPEYMQELAVYDDILLEIVDYFIKTLDRCRKAGIRDVVLDPGFGFAKTAEQSFAILNKLAEFQILDCPILVGISRKSMIYKTLKTDSNHALNGTTVLNTLAISKGATILRVHDVKEAYEVIQLYRATILRK